MVEGMERFRCFSRKLRALGGDPWIYQKPNGQADACKGFVGIVACVLQKRVTRRTGMNIESSASVSLAVRFAQSRTVLPACSRWLGDARADRLEALSYIKDRMQKV